MKFVTACVNCDNTFVPSKGHTWCRKCADKFVESFKDPDQWYILPDPIEASDAECDHDSVQGNLDCPPIEPHIPYIPPVILKDDPQGLQPDPAKIDEAVERIKKLEELDAQPAPAPVDTAHCVGLEREETPTRWWEQLEVAPRKTATEIALLNEVRMPANPTFVSPALDAHITKHVAAVQRMLNLSMREILRKAITTKDLRYAGPIDEKSEKF